jgi:predicted negative regulator of RcsB-dependent stress response
MMRGDCLVSLGRKEDAREAFRQAAEVGSQEERARAEEKLRELD